MEWREEEILVIVKAYPTPSTKYGETVCTAGITKQGNWIRIYPVNYRDLPLDKKYDKFQWIKAKVSKSNEKLKRPESHKIDADSIKVLDKIPDGKGWFEREKYFLPTVSDSLCTLMELRDQKKVSLGAFKPQQVTDFIIKDEEADWSIEQLTALEQQGFFDQEKSTLQKIPYSFYYKFTCNKQACNGHELKIVDWEMGQSYRKFKQLYKDEEITLEKLKQKWQTYFFEERESYLVVGTDSHWNNFMVLTVLSPRRKQGQMGFDFFSPAS
jgi:hypothetical protein